MGRMKKVVIAVATLLVAIAALFCFDANYLILNGRIYSRKSVEVILAGDELPSLDRLSSMEQLKVLDIRNMHISCEEYDTLRDALPGCAIQWCVPFGDAYHDNMAEEVSVSTLAESDVENIQYFPKLKTVDALVCKDYRTLLLLRQKYPQLTVRCTMEVGAQKLRENTTEVTIADGEAEALLFALPMLTELKKVDATNCTEYDTLCEIYRTYPAIDVQYNITVGTGDYSADVEVIELENADLGELRSKLAYFPNLKRVTFTGVLPDNEAIFNLKCSWPDIVFDWEFEILGTKTRSTATKLDLSGIPMDDTNDVEASLKYFYDLQRVDMCECGIPSLEMEALGQRHPETRFVWSFQIGRATVRTDDTTFMSYKAGYHVHRPFYDDEAWELKYCVDMVCLDVGHMKMKDISFLHYMPNLKYLVVADTCAESYEVLRELKELVYLEVFLSTFTDVEILMELPKLEELNIAWTKLENPELLMQMTGLKRLWATNVGLSKEESQQLKDSLPDALVYTTSAHPTEGGWRQSARYREMRDLLGMFYME